VGRIAPILATVTRSICSACGPNENRVLKFTIKLLLLIIMMMTIKMKSTDWNYKIYWIKRLVLAKETRCINYSTRSLNIYFWFVRGTLLCSHIWLLIHIHCTYTDTYEKIPPSGELIRIVFNAGTCICNSLFNDKAFVPVAGISG
jgi:hypothetical protein